MSDGAYRSSGATLRDPSLTATLSIDSGARSAGAVLAIASVWMGRYRVRKALGSGASAAVFEALDLQTQRPLALKVLRSRHPTALARLKAEFRTLAQIAHPNLVAMHELWVDDDARGVISMELVRGESFLEHVRPKALGRRDDARLRAVLQQLVRGVQYLHAHGSLHKDLKPSNVLVSARGHLTIVDFGLAQSTRHAADGGEGSFEGTPAYAAPEQVDGERVTAASDWYAVGSMLYEALCGQRPFTGPKAELLARKAAFDPPAPSARTREAVPAELERVCLQLMARDPARRAHGGDVLAVLGADSHVPELWQPVVTGRDAELVALEAWFAHGQGRTALAILGDSGSGKTSLAGSFLERVRTQDRAHVLSGRCFVHEAVAYNAFDEIVEGLSQRLRQLPEAARDAVLPLDFAPLSRLFPALQGLVHRERLSEPSPSPDASNERGRAFRALHKLLERLTAEHPLLLHIDDLHWADDDSRALLSELLTARVPGLWVLVTARDASPLSAAGQAFEKLVLGPLSDAAIKALARQQLPHCDARLASAIARESAGHPLLAKELIDHVRRSHATLTPGSVGLATALRERLSRLSAPARSALELLCFAGQPVPRSCVLEMSADAGVDLAALRELRVACALRESLRDGVILVEAYHDSIRQLMAADVPDQRARGLHLLLARHLSALGERYLELTVHHYVSGGEWRLAATLAERAAARAAASLALHRSAELLELALQAVECERERERLRLAAADACARAGRNSAAGQHYEAAAEHSTGWRRSELQQRALTAYYVSGETTRGRYVLEQLAAAARLSLEPRPISAARGFAELMLMLWSGLPYLRSPTARFLPARSSARAAEDLQVLWGAAATLTPIDPMASLQFGARALALAARTGNKVIYGQAATLHLGVVPGVLNQRFGLVERRLRQMRRLAQHSSDFWDDAYVRVAQGSASLLASEHASALDAVLEIAQIPQLRTPFSAHVRTSARIVSLLSLYWLGRITQLSELSQAWLEDALDCGDRMRECAFRSMRCYAHLQHDRVDEALSEIERANAIHFDFSVGSDPWWFAGVAQYRGDALGAADLCRAHYVYFHVYARYCASARAEWNLALGGSAAALAVRDIDREQNMKRLRRELWKARFGVGRIVRPIASQLTATHAALSGERSRATAALTRSVEQYNALGMQLHAAGAQLALARLAARNATAHERAAMNVFRAERIARPELWSRFLMPGLME